MITLQQLDEAIELYERCLNEKWSRTEAYFGRVNDGLCYFMFCRYNFNMRSLVPKEYYREPICKTFADGATHQEAFAPRIVFLKTLREELIKEGYYEINE
jgi:hypothetical protein